MPSRGPPQRLALHPLKRQHGCTQVFNLGKDRSHQLFTGFSHLQSHIQSGQIQKGTFQYNVCPIYTPTRFSTLKLSTIFLLAFFLQFLFSHLSVGQINWERIVNEEDVGSKQSRSDLTMTQLLHLSIWTNVHIWHSLQIHFQTETNKE